MTRDMTQGKPLKVMTIFAIPLFIGSIFQQIYNMVDSIVVGNYAGSQALAAVGTFCGQNIGARDFERVKKGMHIGYIISVVYAPVVAVMIIFARPMALLFNQDPRVVKIAVGWLGSLLIGWLRYRTGKWRTKVKLMEGGAG